MSEHLHDGAVLYGICMSSFYILAKMNAKMLWTTANRKAS